MTSQIIKLSFFFDQLSYLAIVDQKKPDDQRPGGLVDEHFRRVQFDRASSRRVRNRQGAPLSDAVRSEITVKSIWDSAILGRSTTGTPSKV